MAAGKDVYEVKNVIIHGGVYRALQFGYGAKQADTGVPDEYNPLPTIALENLNLILPDPESYASPHGHGIPAFTMWIKVEDFFRTVGKQVGCTITKACLQQFPMWNTGSGDWMTPDYNSYDIQKMPDGSDFKINGHPISTVIKANKVPSEYRQGSDHPYDDFTQFFRVFQMPFVISASLFSGSKEIATTDLFSMETDYGTWKGPSDYTSRWGAADNVGITKPVTLAGTVDSMNDPVTLVVFNESTCSCDQTGLLRPVFSKDITEYIPPVDPYIWRRFGKNKTEDPVGNAINPEKLDGKWHLVRPLYCTDGTRWVNVEEDVDQ